VPAGETLLLDTSVVIAYLDRRDRTSPVASGILDGLVRPGRNPAVVSTVTVAEVLVGPARSGDDALQAAILEFMTQFPGLRVEALDLRIAQRAATLRARYRMRLADALIVGTGLIAGAGRIVSNDRDWRAMLASSSIGAGVVLLDDHLPFDS
jgi:predicted nucleic acid-binding protein